MSDPGSTVSEDLEAWTFNIVKTAGTVFGRFWQSVWYYMWRKPETIISVNEREDPVVFKEERLNYELQQKLGVADIGSSTPGAIWPRSRDYQRLGGAYGWYKQPPDPERARST